LRGRATADSCDLCYESNKAKNSRNANDPAFGAASQGSLPSASHDFEQENEAEASISAPWGNDSPWGGGDTGVKSNISGSTFLKWQAAAAHEPILGIDRQYTRADYS
jgi:hypothetical protein